MTLPRWSASLPRPERNSFALGLGDNRRMQFAQEGPPRPRRGWSQVGDTQSYLIVATRNERALFERFFHEDTKRGALPFVMPDAGTDGWGLETDEGVALTTEDGEVIVLAADWLCMFGQGLPQITPTGMHWQITFSLVLLP